MPASDSRTLEGPDGEKARAEDAGRNCHRLAITQVGALGLDVLDRKVTWSRHGRRRSPRRPHSAERARLPVGPTLQPLEVGPQR